MVFKKRMDEDYPCSNEDCFRLLKTAREHNAGECKSCLAEKEIEELNKDLKAKNATIKELEDAIGVIEKQRKANERQTGL